MLDPKFCNNHPSAKAIAACHRCAVDLCGMCGHFIDEIVLCENCSEIHEAEKFVSKESEKLEQPISTLIVDKPAAEQFVPPTRRKSSNKFVQWAVIGIAFCIISAQLYFYNNPAPVPQDPATLARDQQLSSLVQCMLVFREIGLTLQEGRMPSSTLHCADSDSENVIRSEEGNLRVYHPNPQYYGYAEISVGDDTPEPTLIRLEQ